MPANTPGAAAPRSAHYNPNRPKTLADCLDRLIIEFPQCVFEGEERNGGQYFHCLEPIYMGGPWIRAYPEFARHLGHSLHQAIVDGREEHLTMDRDVRTNNRILSAEFPERQFIGGLVTTSSATAQLFECLDCALLTRQSKFQGFTNMRTHFLEHASNKLKKEKTIEEAEEEDESKLNKSLTRLRCLFPEAEVDGEVVAGLRAYGSYPQISFFFSCSDCQGWRKAGEVVMERHLKTAGHKAAVKQRLGGE